LKYLAKKFSRKTFSKWLSLSQNEEYILKIINEIGVTPSSISRKMSAYINTSTIDNNLFHALTENNLLQILSLTLAVLCVLVCPPLLYSVIWFEKFGSDKKRTLINKLVSMNCWNTIGYLIFVQTLEILRFIHGPLPGVICAAQNVLRFSFGCSIVLNADATLVANYAYIFWLKNPAGFHDDFWCNFISAWIYLMSFLIMGTLHTMDEFQIQPCLICMGKVATQELELVTMRGVGYILIASGLINIVLHMRISNYKKVRNTNLFVFKII
jgi:hypothetical protein